MAVGEFELIRRFFARPARRPDTLLGIGDDCALLGMQPGRQLAVTTDTLVAGIHFFPDVAPDRLGHKSLAVNLSDLAAMGAEPAWASLALTIPDADEGWLAEFARGLFELAERFGLDLIGGDTTRGPLSITITAFGWVEHGQALTRGGASPGDSIYLSGALGTAGLALRQLAASRIPTPEALDRLEIPQPRVDLGRCLRGIASACIDVSDGLAADLGHILGASGVGAELDWRRLPFVRAVTDEIECSGDHTWPLHAGDDYELCFTVSPQRETQLAALADSVKCAWTRIGQIEAAPGLRLRRGDRIEALMVKGYEHFSS